MIETLGELLRQGASLLREAGAREVYVFGSVAQGRMRENSDVDLAVSGLPPEVFYATMARLSDLFERSVDLVDLDDTTPFVTYLKKKGVLQRVAWMAPLVLGSEDLFNEFRAELARFSDRMESGRDA